MDRLNQTVNGRHASAGAHDSRHAGRPGRTAILVSSVPGQPAPAELNRQAAAGERPRKDYVELAKYLHADVIDTHYMQTRALLPSRLAAERGVMWAGQILEAYLRRDRYQQMLAWSDHLGFKLALAFKLARSRRDLVMMSNVLSTGKRAEALRRFRLHTHLRAIVNYGSVQMEIAATDFGIPRQKLFLALSPVDERFWRPESVEDMAAGPAVCAAGWEARDYPTLVAAARGADFDAEIALGTMVRFSETATGPAADRMRAIMHGGLPANVRLAHQLSPRELRALYARVRVVVVPLEDVDFDAGVTAATEAMAMGKPVVVTRTRGQIDVLRDGEHGLYVPPGDPAALRAAITHLLTHPDEAERMGRAGRALVEQQHTLDAYTARLARIVLGTEPNLTARRSVPPLDPGRRPDTVEECARGRGRNRGRFALARNGKGETNQSPRSSAIGHTPGREVETEPPLSSWRVSGPDFGRGEASDCRRERGRGGAGGRGSGSGSRSTRTAILVSGLPGQPGCAELERLAVSGERPRKDYVELAKLIDADVIDSEYMATRAAAPARLVARRVGMWAGQVVEVYLRGRRYGHVFAWADKLGLPLAALDKLTGRRRDLVLVSVWLSGKEKDLLVRRLKVHTHIRAIAGRSLQQEIAATRFGIPRDKLYIERRGVDHRFWCPQGGPVEDLVCAVGWEARDYSTLIEATRDQPLDVELAVGHIALPSLEGVDIPLPPQLQGIMRHGGLPPNVRMTKLNPRGLRDLYARSRVVVVPVEDVEFDAGVTAVTEAMAMAKPVIVTRTPGIADLFEDGVQGIYVPPGDVMAMRAAITRLIEHPEDAERMGRAGRALVEERHTLDACMARLAGIIHGTIAATDPAPVVGRGVEASWLTLV